MSADHTRTQLRRGASHGVDDRALIHQIIDENLLCHVGFVVNGSPVVIPTCHWRVGDRLYWHAHRLAANVAPNHNGEVCITITQLDGLVLARSAFNHSVNYHSVMVFGVATPVLNKTEKQDALRQLTDKMSPDRWQALRPVTDAELAATGVSYLPLDEVSCKVSRGDAEDNPADINWPVWAGVVPIVSVPGVAIPNSNLQGDYPPPTAPKLARSPTSSIPDHWQE